MRRSVLLLYAVSVGILGGAAFLLFRDRPDTAVGLLVAQARSADVFGLAGLALALGVAGLVAERFERPPPAVGTVQLPPLESLDPGAYRERLLQLASDLRPA